MKRLLLLTLIITFNVNGQSIRDLKKTALRDAKIVSNASLKEDTPTLLKFTHPEIIKKYGRVKTMEIIDDVFGMMKAQNIYILSSNVNTVDNIVKEKGEYRCIVSNTIKMDLNGREMTVKSSLFGFYNKKQQSWSFIESSKLLNDPETMEIFPNFKTAIDIPDDEYIEG